MHPEPEDVELERILSALDHPAPRLSAEALMTRARAERARGYRWAAGLLLALGVAGAAYAVPGSPLRRWISSRFVSPRPLPPVSQPQPPVAPAGIAVDPGRRLQIVFQDSAPRPDSITLSFSEDSEVAVRTTSGSASFRSGFERLESDTHGLGSRFEIRIPRLAPLVEILAADRRVFLKQGSRVTKFGVVCSKGRAVQQPQEDTVS